jgi:hypothetical protein
VTGLNRGAQCEKRIMPGDSSVGYYTVLVKMFVPLIQNNVLHQSSAKQNSVQNAAGWMGGVSMSLTHRSCKDYVQSTVPFPVALIGYNSGNLPHN